MRTPSLTFSLCLVSVVLSGAAQAAPAATAPVEPLTIERAVELAVFRNERSRSAVHVAEAAQARQRGARAFFFPELSATAGYTRRFFESSRAVGGQDVTLQSLNTLSAAGVLRWAVFDGRSIPLYRQARAEAEAATLEAAETQRLIAFEAADAFLQSLTVQGVSAAAVRRQELAAQTYREAQARFEGGLVSSNDVTRAQLELATAEREAIRARGLLDTALLNFSYLLDTPLDGGLAAPTAQLRVASQVVDGTPRLIEEAMRQRLDVLALQRRAEAASLFAQEPTWRLLPSLALAALYPVTSVPGLAGRSDNPSLGLELSWTLFDGGERYAQRDERLALAEAAALSARASERRVAVDVQAALIALTTAQAAQKQAKVAAEVARKNARETQELYRQGLTGALEVADATVRLFEAEVGMERELYGLGLALFDLRASLGKDPLGQSWSAAPHATVEERR